MHPWKCRRWWEGLGLVSWSADVWTVVEGVVEGALVYAGLRVYETVCLRGDGSEG